MKAERQVGLGSHYHIHLILCFLVLFPTAINIKKWFLLKLYAFYGLLFFLIHLRTFSIFCIIGGNYTPVLSQDQDLKKDTNKRSTYSEPLRPTDTGKYCQNLETLGKTDFLPKKLVKKTWKWAKNVLVWYSMVWYGKVVILDHGWI